jgi:toxin YoeB
MNNFFLLNEALDTYTVLELEMGISHLNEITISRNREFDVLLKHGSIWSYSTRHGGISEFCYSVVSPELQRLVPRVFESMQTHDTYFTNEVMFDAAFPNDCNGFLGIDFSRTAIPANRQVASHSAFLQFRNTCWTTKVAANSAEQAVILQQLYPGYVFTAESVDDAFQLNTRHHNLYERLQDLIIDIKAHPFAGGLGKTEVLKNMSGVASKRINDEHRLTYSLKNDVITVLRCRGHYE